MIKTNSYNDFSSFSYEERRDPTFMFQQLKEFSKNGGDCTLPIQLESYGDKIELIQFRDYVNKYIASPEEFLMKLMNEGILPSMSDFKWNSQEGSIEEAKGYGIKWMGQNYDQYSEMIQQSFRKLLKQLPDDMEKVSLLKTYDYYGKIETSGYINPLSKAPYTHPLIKITEAIDQEDIYNILFTEKPAMKEFWEKPNPKRDEQPYFLQTIEALWNEVRRPSLAVVFYKHGIGVDELHKESNESKLQDIIRYASFSGDLDFLNIALPKVNLSKLENNKHAYQLSLTRAKNADVVKLLLKHGAIIEQDVISERNSKDVYNTNVLFSEELKNVEVFDAILETNPKYVEQIQSNPHDFYKLMQSKDFAFTKLLVEKYQFPLEKFDMLEVAWKKTNDEGFEWLVKNGADIRNCHSFCGSLVQAREDGLKKIRALNKAGIIVAKSPDMIFGIFSHNPTKNFVTYYDKLTATELEKYTIDGYPAWWGAKNQNDIKFMLSRINQPEQLAKDGKPYLNLLLELELDRKINSPKDLFKPTLDKILKKNPNYELDLSYTDSNGNNFIHTLVSVKEYGKNSIDVDLFELIATHSNNKAYDSFMKKNNSGITPLEIVLTQKTKNSWSSDNILRKIISNGNIDFTQSISTGEKIGDKFLEYFADDKNILPQIHSLILSNELKGKEEVKIKKMKI